MAWHGMGTQRRRHGSRRLCTGQFRWAKIPYKNERFVEYKLEIDDGDLEEIIGEYLTLHEVSQVKALDSIWEISVYIVRGSFEVFSKLLVR